MKTSIISSSVSIVPATTSISNCVREMRNRGIGSLLIVSDDARQELVGIFTERDVIKQIDKIQHGGHWDRPVRLVMTHPVISISSDQIDDAPRMMIRHGIRHLPITTVGKDGATVAVGILSMRDLFKEMLEGFRPAHEARDKPALPTEATSVGLLGNDPSLFEFLKQVLRRVPRIRLLKLTTASPITDLEAIFVDLDRIPREEWEGVVSRSWKLKDPPLIAVFYEQRFHSDEERKRIQALARGKKVAAFAKPVDVISFLSWLTSGFQSK